jgi:hypothetical protein
MENDKNGLERLLAVVAGILILVVVVFVKPYMALLFLFVGVVVFTIYNSTSNKRDEYYKARNNLMFIVASVGFLVACFYYLHHDSFLLFDFHQSSFVLYSYLIFALSLFLLWFNKRAVPISFLSDDDRMVQETMYEDYDYQTLGEAFAYRGLKFRDELGNKITPKTASKAVGKLSITELRIDDLEMVAINSKGSLKFYYEKLIYDMYNDLIFNNGGKQEDFRKIYGYNFTIKKGLKNIVDFRNALKDESLLYSKIFYFLEKEMNNPAINLKLNFRKLYVDNLCCLELCLIASILMVRQYVNFPVGDLMKYVKTPKDINFMGCFSSLPADFSNVNSTAINPKGCAYYYIFYKLHLAWFVKVGDKEVVRTWVK